MAKFLKWRAPYKLGGLPDACQGLGDKRAGLLGRWRLIPPALDRFGHDRMAGGVIAFRGPLRGMGSRWGRPSGLRKAPTLFKITRWT